jgi:hypothetical protein
MAGPYCHNIPFIAIDYNFSIVEKAKREGIKLSTGSMDFDYPRLCRGGKAMAIIITLPDSYSQESVYS